MSDIAPSYGNIRWLFLPCSDLAAMRRFYSELLGMQETSFKDEGSMNWLCYRCGTLDVVMTRHEAASERQAGWAEQPGWEGGSLAAVSWAVKLPEERFAEVVRKLASARVTAYFPQPSWQQDSYWSYPVHDPSGNTVELYCEPALRPDSTQWPSP